ncbi:hypothetical protein Ndes2437B_g02062 [Nannochloris sp. 'desiccata']
MPKIRAIEQPLAQIPSDMQHNILFFTISGLLRSLLALALCLLVEVLITLDLHSLPAFEAKSTTPIMPALTSATIGFPRIGPKREMKKALEDYWAGKSSQADLVAVSQATEAGAWAAQAQAGIDLIALDGTYYDQILDTISYLGLIPERFNALSGLDRYFAAARGTTSAIALDMSKYYDTNYHQIVPELNADSVPVPDWGPLLDRVRRGQAVVGAAKAVPLLVGPLTFVALSHGEFNASEMTQRLVPAYVEALNELAKLGVPEVQIHEPVFTGASAVDLRADAEATYAALAAAGVPISMVIPYDDVFEEVYTWLVELPVAAISLDFCGVPGAAAGNGTAQLIAKHGFPKTKRLGAGVIDGRSVWADDGTALRLVAALRAHLGPDQAITVQSSTSLLHVPVDLSLETNLPKDLIPRLAFAVQKLNELTHVVQELSTLEQGTSKSFVEPLDLATFTGGPTTTPASTGHFSPEMFSRSETYEVRRAKQTQFPAFPTTTIGSFPQTAAIRRARLQFKKGTISAEEYKERMAAEIGYAVGIQDALGLDVLVHGEPERTDMVEVFGVKLDGFVFTEYGWVQSYGSRYVRPPIIAGDVSRPEAMTVHEFKLAQAVTTKPVKGMLTGPVTILNWSFPRKDILRSTQAFQIALALREEVADLENAGCVILQVDEPALREGLPLKPSRWDSYLVWATAAFRLATSVANSHVQIVTHLCYSQFEDIMKAIDDLQADVLTIENSRSSNEMVIALAKYGYSRDLGPGVYDVHSPVVPTVEFMAEKLRSFLNTGILGGDATRIHVNPDCGLKTRRWEEVVPSIRNMVEAARQVRAEIAGPAAGGDEGTKIAVGNPGCHGNGSCCR